jgi:hypothetical protein
MVRAILEGRKTQTRRIIKPQPVYQLPGFIGWAWNKGGSVWQSGVTPESRCPYGQRGDRLWVRETWAKDIPECPNGVTYRADHFDPLGDGPAKPITWKPSIHMPRIASRITLEITGIRAERLNAVSNQDILREGVRSESCNICPHTGGSGCDQCMMPARPFIALWDSINAKCSSWSSNPWVWVVEFKRVSHAS